MKNQAVSRGCFAAALRLLARRDHSCAELSGKLEERGFSRNQIQRAVDRCLRFYYLDDERFALAYAEQLQRRGYGCRRIQQMLADKGVAHETISGCLEALCSDAVQIRDCRKAVIKKLNKNPSPDASPEAKAKLHRFLLGRGFSPTIIRQVLDEQAGRTIV
jgi:regulatory protein